MTKGGNLVNDWKNRDIRNIGKSISPFILMEKSANIGWDCVIDTSGGITIGENVEIGRGTIIYTHHHNIDNLDWRSTRPTYISISIHDNVFIGSKCVILPQVKYIGKGAIIGAGSVVTKDVPDYEVWAGNPARKIRDRKC